MAAEYKPGFFRKRMSGMTQGMRDLLNYLDRFPDEKYILKQNELTEVLRIIAFRKWRTMNNLNPTRNPRGLTDTVFKNITIEVLQSLENYYMESIEQDEKIDKTEKNSLEFKKPR